MGRTDRRDLSVAIAVIERRGRFLVCRRATDDDHGGCWEFPGGTRERGEPWEACLRRELLEELGVTLGAVTELDRFRYRYPRRQVSFRVFRCAIAHGTPRPLDAQALRWVPRRRLGRYRFPPANQRLIQRLTGGLATTPRRGIMKIT